MDKTAAVIADEQQLILSNLSPGPAQKRLALAVVVALPVAFFLTAGPLLTIQLPRIDAFVPAYAMAMFVNDAITAVLLFAQFSILRSRALLVIASGYLFTAFIIIPWLLTFPGVFAPGGLLGAGLQSTNWLYILWHGGFPTFVMGYALLKDADSAKALWHGSVGAGLLSSVVATMAIVSAATFLFTAGDAYLPRISLDPVHFSNLWLYVAGCLSLWSVLTLIVLWIRRRSVLDLWLMVVMCAYAIEIYLVAFPGLARFTLGWYLGRVFGFLSGSLVLFVLLYEITTVYAKLLHTGLVERLNKSLEAENAERMRAERSARQAERELQVIIDSIPVNAARYRPDGTLDFVNQTWRTFTGLSQEGLRGQRWGAAIHPDDLPKIEAVWRAHMSTGEPFQIEQRLRRAGGEYRRHWVRHVPYRNENGEVTGWYGASWEIEDQKRAEQALHLSERELRALIETMPAIAVAALPDGSPTFVNRRWTEYSGLSAEDTEGSGWKAAIHPEDFERWLNLWRVCLATGQPFEDEVRFRRAADGEYRWFWTRGVALRDEQGSIAGWYGLGIDVQDRKSAEQDRERLRQLERQAEQELRTTVDNIPAIAARYRADGSLDFVNQTWRTYTGLSQDSLRRHRWGTAIHPDDLPRVEAAWRAHLPTGEPFEMEHRMRRADGEYRWHFVRRVPHRDEKGEVTAWYGVAHDIQDQKRAEYALQTTQAELAHVTRVTTLGEMSASIAHEVNQPLAAIVTNAEATVRWLGRDVPDLEEARSAIGCVVREAHRAGEVIHRIRGFLKKADPQMTQLDINDVVEEAVRLVQYEALRHGVTIRLEFASGLPPVRGDRIQLQQVIVNLAVNGMEAMTSLQDRERVLIARTQRDQSDRVLVAVEDAGVGIEPENLNRVFRAFHTTKPGGLGMGLAICRSIIEAHGGRLWAEANVPRGAIFRFTVPAVTASTSEVMQ